MAPTALATDPAVVPQVAATTGACDVVGGVVVTAGVVVDVVAGAESSG